jgi:hypothetical protein
MRATHPPHTIRLPPSFNHSSDSILCCAVLCLQAARPSPRRRAASAQVSLAGSNLLRAAALGAGATMAAEGFLTDGACTLSCPRKGVKKQGVEG